MPFSDFHGNAECVRHLRDMLARDRFPHAVVLSGAPGSGKYTLALMLAQALNCLSPLTTDGLPDFCGQCANCTRIGQALDLDARCAEAVEARENLREADKKETRLFVQTHPDVLVIPPDPPQMMIKVDQVRRVIETIYYQPGEAKERVYIFTQSAFMKEAANSLLKVLEEPPEYATIYLLTENPGELLKVTETYRAGAEGRDKIEELLRTLYSLLQDLTFLNSSTPELVRNTDIQAELKKLAEAADFDWIAADADRLSDVERGMRRNLLRSLSLDAFATALERST